MTLLVESHIVIDEDGVAKIIGTDYKVRLLAQEHQLRSYTPELLHEAHPDLSLGQIHSALAYYYDHKQEIDTDLASRRLGVEHRHAKASEPPIVTKLKSESRWPYPFTLTEE